MMLKRFCIPYLMIVSIIGLDSIFCTSSRNNTARQSIEKNGWTNSSTSRYLRQNGIEKDSTRMTPSHSDRRSLSDYDAQTNQSYPNPQLNWHNEQDDLRVPFWNIAHMINAVEQIEPALSKGANGIEVDISFDKRGIPTETYHGFPCDCGRFCHDREKFLEFIKHLASISNPPAKSNLQLVLFDLKLKGLNNEQKEVAGRFLADTLNKYVYEPYSRVNRKGEQFPQPPLRFIISINHVIDNGLVHSFIKYIRENRLDFMGQQVGFDVGMNDNLTDISDMWSNLHEASFNIWQGDGLTNCANIVRSIDRVKEAISIRNGQGHFRKIYFWTVDVMYHIRSVLRLGLDAVLTNQPQRVVQVLNEPEFRTKYRLATPFDDPFAQFWIKPSAWKMSPPSLNEAVETVTNIRETSENFVKTLPVGISTALKKVHQSISFLY